MMKIMDIVRKLGEFLAPLIEFAQKFRGFLALAAFLVLAGTFIFAFMFTQGSFDDLISNFEKLSSDQFFWVVLVAMGLVFGVNLLLILLSYQDVTSNDDRYTLRVMVHDEEDETLPVNDATVTLLLDEAIPERTNERGGTSFRFSRKWQGQECQINARHDRYTPRAPLTVRLRPNERVLIPLTRLSEGDESMSTPGDPVAMKVFISHSAADTDSARKLAARLKQAGFSVSPVGRTRPAAEEAAARLTRLIRRADVVLVLMSLAAEGSADRVADLALAQEAGVPVVPVQLEPEALPFAAIDDLEPVFIYLDWESEGNALCQRLRDLQPAPPAPPVRPAARPRPSDRPQSGSTSRPAKKASSDLPDINPFVSGSAVRPDLFVGRDDALHKIRGRIGGELQSVSVVANRRMGKTSLLRYAAKRYPQLFPAGHNWAVVYMDMMDVRTHSVAGVMRILRKAIAKQTKHQLWGEVDDGRLNVMAEAFEELAEIEEVRLVLCLDEWEQVMMHAELDNFIEQLRASGSMTRIGMIVATAQELSTLAESGGLASPFYNIFETIYLGLMPDREWTSLVHDAFERSGREVRPREVALVGELAGGHPNLTQIAGSLVWDARHRRWSEALIRTAYAQKARTLFRQLWQAQSDAQKNVLREVLGLTPTTTAAEATWDELRRRGVLLPDNEVFCQPFADFVYAREKRNREPHAVHPTD